MGAPAEAEAPPVKAVGDMTPVEAAATVNATPVDELVLQQGPEEAAGIIWKSSKAFQTENYVKLRLARALMLAAKKAKWSVVYPSIRLKDLPEEDAVRLVEFWRAMGYPIEIGGNPAASKPTPQSEKSRWAIEADTSEEPTGLESIFGGGG